MTCIKINVWITSLIGVKTFSWANKKRKRTRRAAHDEETRSAERGRRCGP